MIGGWFRNPDIFILALICLFGGTIPALLGIEPLATLTLNRIRLGDYVGFMRFLFACINGLLFSLLGESLYIISLIEGELSKVLLIITLIQYLLVFIFFVFGVSQLLRAFIGRWEDKIPMWVSQGKDAIKFFLLFAYIFLWIVLFYIGSINVTYTFSVILFTLGAFYLSLTYFFIRPLKAWWFSLCVGLAVFGCLGLLGVTYKEEKFHTRFQVFLYAGYVDGVKKMLEKKSIDLSRKDNEGNTYLYWPVKKGDLEMVKLLINAGADVNVKNNIGHTPLFEVGKSKNAAAITKLLLSAGADVAIKNNDDKTALDFAKSQGHKDVVRVLIKSGSHKK